MSPVTRLVGTAGALSVVAVMVVVLTAQATGISAKPPADFAAFDPGPLTRWGLPLVRTIGTSTAVLCVGALLAALVLGQTGRQHWLLVEDLKHYASWFALATALAQCLQVLLGVSNAFGLPALQIHGTELLAGLKLTSILYCVAGIAGALTLCLVARTKTSPDRVLLLALAVTAVPFMGGHSGSSPNHLVSQAFIVVHVTAAAVWVGGLAMLVYLGLLRRDTAAMTHMLPSYSRLALGCAAATVLSGIGNSVVRLPDNGYGATYLALLVMKLGLFGVLCGFGFVHRRAGFSRPGPVFVRRAFAEVTVMVVVIAVATVLSQLNPAG